MNGDNAGYNPRETEPKKLVARDGNDQPTVVGDRVRFLHEDSGEWEVAAIDECINGYTISITNKDHDTYMHEIRPSDLTHKPPIKIGGEKMAYVGDTVYDENGKKLVVSNTVSTDTEFPYITECLDEFGDASNYDPTKLFLKPPLTENDESSVVEEACFDADPLSSSRRVRTTDAPDEEPVLTKDRVEMHPGMTVYDSEDREAYIVIGFSPDRQVVRVRSVFTGLIDYRDRECFVANRPEQDTLIKLHDDIGRRVHCGHGAYDKFAHEWYHRLGAILGIPHDETVTERLQAVAKGVEEKIQVVRPIEDEKDVM